MIETILLRPWAIWAIAALVFFIAEMALPYFACIFIAAAAGVTAIGAAFHFNRWFQLGTFAFVSVFSLVLIRPKLKHASSKSPGIPDRVDEYLGKQGTITHGTHHAGEIGRVLILGHDWAAQSETLLHKGDVVEIVGSDGIHLIVRKST